MLLNLIQLFRQLLFIHTLEITTITVLLGRTNPHMARIPTQNKSDDGRAHVTSVKEVNGQTPNL